MNCWMCNAVLDYDAAKMPRVARLSVTGVTAQKTEYQITHELCESCGERTMNWMRKHRGSIVVRFHVDNLPFVVVENDR